MTRRVFIPAVLALAAATAVLLGACKATDSAGNMSAKSKSAPSGTTEVNADGVRRVTAAELQAMLEDGSAVVYDTRAKSNYDTEHIKGSLSMPLDEVSNRVGELPKDKTLVFYCT
ncbi:MAG: rhodanese-like domain-containing protein [Pyrinomonadaceae bacterium]